MPLQLFIPLQLFFADLHSDIPLQEFTPVQWTVAVALSAATDTLASPDVNNIAAAAAMAALDNLLICMMDSSIVIERSEIAASPTKTRSTRRLLLNYLSLCRIQKMRAHGQGQEAARRVGKPSHKVLIFHGLVRNCTPGLPRRLRQCAP
jgi:hypothetical protein